MMPQLQKAISNNEIPADQVRQQLYEIYGCITNDGQIRNISKLYKKKIDEFVSQIFVRIVETSVDNVYITQGLNDLGFHVMQSLRDTEKQLIVEVN